MSLAQKKTEKSKSEKEKQKAEKNVIDVPVSRDDKMAGNKSVKAIKKKYTTPKKQKLRKINLSNIQTI